MSVDKVIDLKSVLHLTEAQSTQENEVKSVRIECPVCKRNQSFTIPIKYFVKNTNRFTVRPDDICPHEFEVVFDKNGVFRASYATPTNLTELIANGKKPTPAEGGLMNEICLRFGELITKDADPSLYDFYWNTYEPKAREVLTKKKEDLPYIIDLISEMRNKTNKSEREIRELGRSEWLRHDKKITLVESLVFATEALGVKLEPTLKSSIRAFISRVRKSRNISQK